MSQLTPVFLTIHILTAIVAFGPSFAFPLISAMAGREPQHGLFALRLMERTERRIILPAALAMPVSGLLLVWSEGIDLAATHWLLLAIALFIVAVGFSVLIQVPTVERMIDVATEMSGRRPALAAGPGAALAADAETAGTAGEMDLGAQMAALGRRAQAGGMFLSLMIVVIVALMSGKPSF
jgi:uncharacterized membrane protein